MRPCTPLLAHAVAAMRSAAPTAIIGRNRLGNRSLKRETISWETSRRDPRCQKEKGLDGASPGTARPGGPRRLQPIENGYFDPDLDRIPVRESRVERPAHHRLHGVFPQGPQPARHDDLPRVSVRSHEHAKQDPALNTRVLRPVGIGGLRGIDQLGWAVDGPERGQDLGGSRARRAFVYSTLALRADRFRRARKAEVRPLEILPRG